MPKSVDEFVQEMFGRQSLELAVMLARIESLQAENEALRARLNQRAPKTEASNAPEKNTA